ncbi:protein rep, partial [Escherichia coli]
GAVAETLKYSTKPADMVADPEWFLELTRQTHKRRFVATGGALRHSPPGQGFAPTPRQRLTAREKIPRTAHRS